MRVQSNLKLAGELSTIDPALMFQRLVTVAKSSDEELLTFFKYKLCFLPALLYELNDPLRFVDKPIPANAIWREVLDLQLKIDCLCKSLDEPQYILDDGALVYRLSWRTAALYAGICIK